VTVIVAPNVYFRKYSETRRFDVRIPYEEFMEVLRFDDRQVFEGAIQKANEKLSPKVPYWKRNPYWWAIARRRRPW
jgi:hypothetical protein